MTPAQMLRRIKPEQDLYNLVTTMLSDDDDDIRFAKQSEALSAGKCPLCHAAVDSELDNKGQFVYFRCVRQPVFHEWRRSASFITRD